MVTKVHRKVHLPQTELAVLRCLDKGIQKTAVY